METIQSGKMTREQFNRIFWDTLEGEHASAYEVESSTNDRLFIVLNLEEALQWIAEFNPSYNPNSGYLISDLTSDSGLTLVIREETIDNPESLNNAKHLLNYFGISHDLLPKHTNVIQFPLM